MKSIVITTIVTLFSIQGLANPASASCTIAIKSSLPNVEISRTKALRKALKRADYVEVQPNETQLGFVITQAATQHIPAEKVTDFDGKTRQVSRPREDYIASVTLYKDGQQVQSEAVVFGSLEHFPPMSGAIGMPGYSAENILEAIKLMLPKCE